MCVGGVVENKKRPSPKVHAQLHYKTSPVRATVNQPHSDDRRNENLLWHVCSQIRTQNQSEKVGRYVHEPTATNATKCAVSHREFQVGTTFQNECSSGVVIIVMIVVAEPFFVLC